MSKLCEANRCVRDRMNIERLRTFTCDSMTHWTYAALWSPQADVDIIHSFSRYCHLYSLPHSAYIPYTILLLNVLVHRSGLTPLCIAAIPKLKSSHPAPSSSPPGTINPASPIIPLNSSWLGNRSMLSTRYW